MRFITLDVNNKVIAVRHGSSVLDGEIESELGEIGQIMQPDRTFITPETEQTIPKPSLEEQIQALKQDNLILMDALATVFEEVMMLREELTYGGVVLQTRS